MALTKKPAPVDDSSEMTEQDIESYKALARKAGFDAVNTAVEAQKKQIQSVAFRGFLSENGITVYDDGTVRSYMDLITPFGKQWLWLGTAARSGSSWSVSHTWRGGQYRQDDDRSYSKLIPEAVLMTMVKIREAYRSAQFQVTDIKDIPKGDPFLRVSVDGDEWFIIERWSEPKFRS